MAYIIKLQAPSIESFSELRQFVGWQNPAKSLLKTSIDNSLFWVCVYDCDKLIATGRVIGDGAMYFYIQDVIVAPDYQRQHIGVLIMNSIERYLHETCIAGATVGLLCAQGREEFYAQFGYTKRDGSSLGFGMCKFI